MPGSATFACFASSSPCTMRVTARWDAATSLNEYEETIDGETIHCRDTFLITCTTLALTAAIDTGHNSWQTVISKSNRH